MKNSRKSKKLAGSSTVSYQDLESRRLLAIFTVDTTSMLADGSQDGFVSLGEAIMAANTNLAFGDAAPGDFEGDRIHFDPSLDGQTILLDSQLEITEGLVIQGFDSDITIDGGGGNRIFEIATNDQVVLGNLNLNNGRANEGGALLTRGGGDVRLFHVDFDGNTSTTFFSGGGAVFNLNSRIFASEVSFTNNFSFGYGGAIFSADGQLFLDQATFEFNHAQITGGAILAAEGGYFFNESRFFKNDAFRQLDVPGADNSGFHYGASIEKPNANLGGGVAFAGSAGISVMTNAIFTSNFAFESGGGIAIGEGNKVYVHGNSVFTTNSADGNINSRNGGGAVFAKDAVFSSGGATFNRNAVLGGSGGAILSVGGILRAFNATFDGNGAARNGGAVAGLDNFTYVNSGQFLNNESGGVPDIFRINDISHQSRNGGALYIGGGDNSLGRVFSSTFDGNSSVQNGGAIGNAGRLLIAGDTLIKNNIAFASDNGFARGGGGGIYTTGVSLEVYSSTIEGNEARGEFADGGGFYVEDGSRVRVGFSDVRNNLSDKHGGGFAIYGGDVSTHDTRVEGNQANANGSELVPGVGGGYYVSGRQLNTLSITGGTIKDNSAVGSGGGIYAGNQVRLNIRTVDDLGLVQIQNNSSAEAGGGIHSNQALLNIRDSVFESNSAPIGGGISLIEGSASIFDTSISLNSATERGGGIHQVAIESTLTNSSVFENEAPVDPDIATIL